jgi:hypothetical protein
MPGYVLNASATVTCAHKPGKATPTQVFAKVLVAGAPVITADTQYGVAGCSMPAPTAGNGPCATATFMSGFSTKVLAGGRPLLLSTSVATCVPTATPLAVTIVQTKVIAT